MRISLSVEISKGRRFAGEVSTIVVISTTQRDNNGEFTLTPVTLEYRIYIRGK